MRELRRAAATLAKRRPLTVTAIVAGGALAVLAVILATAGSGPMRPPSDPLAIATPAGREQLPRALNAAQATIDDAASDPATLAAAGSLEQAATFQLLGDPVRVRRATLSRLRPAAAATLRATLAAGVQLAALSVPARSLPRWRIVRPPAPATLLRYYRRAQARSGVPWEYLAAIELIETGFGRIDGISSAGAEGPMQFMPATWSEYGSGRVGDQQDAIRSAARYLAANGAPRDIAGALFHYNHSDSYVRAVEDYAARMRANGRNFYGFYNWQVVYDLNGRALVLPVGYPRVRPLRLL